MAGVEAEHEGDRGLIRLVPGWALFFSMQRIVVTGSESTGKTTLAHDLAAWLGVPWISEYARAYAVAKHGLLGPDDVDPIARGQIAHEDDIIAAAAGDLSYVVLDTDLMSTPVYAEHYYGAAPPWIAIEAMRRKGDLYLLADTDIPWSADGVRDRPLARREIHDRFEARLREIGAAWVAVDGLGSRRLEHAIAAVRGWRAACAARAPRPVSGS